MNEDVFAPKGKQSNQSQLSANLNSAAASQTKK
jgi:hypothetical protein